MSYSVICPSCKERNPGNAFRCVKCNADLVGVPRHEDAPSIYDTASRRQAGAPGPALPRPESFVHALSRWLLDSVAVFFLVAVCTALVCFLGNWRTPANFGTGLIVAGFVLILGVGSGQLFRRYWYFSDTGSDAYWELPREPRDDRLKRLSTGPVFALAAALCLATGWLIFSVAR